MHRKWGLVLTLAFLIVFSSSVLADGIYKNIKAYFYNIKIHVNGEEVYTDTEPFIYNDRVYVPIRFVVENMGGAVKWDGSNKKVYIKSYRDFPECNPLEGENFVYGLITSIDYDEKTIEIEQHFDDNSIEVTPLLQVREDAVFVLKRNDKMMNIDFKDLKCGDDVGMVLDKDKKIRGIIITF